MRRENSDPLAQSEVLMVTRADQPAVHMETRVPEQDTGNEVQQPPSEEILSDPNWQLGVVLTRAVNRSSIGLIVVRATRKSYC